MSKVQRIRAVLVAILMLFCALILFLFGENGYGIVVLILGLSLLIYSIRMLVYYLSMARYMVGGRLILYLGVILLDLALFVGGLSDIPKVYIMLYMVAGYLFSGAVDILRALESKRMGAKSWRMKTMTGAVNVIIALICLFNIRRGDVVVDIYALGLVYSAIMRVISAFRKTAIVYIQ